MTRPALDRLRAIDIADVFKGEDLAGSLRRAEDGTVAFTYREGYSGPAVASTLPVATAPVISPGGGVPPFFAGLLPEGHRLSVLRRATKTSADDELTLLLAVGADAPGDVRIFPQGTCPYDEHPLATDDPALLDFHELAEMPDRTGLPGVQSKTSASMVNVPVRFRDRSALLKLDPPEHPHLVINEALHLTHASALTLPVSAHTVLHDRYGVPGLLVRRFDRTVTEDGSVRRLGVEDGAQVLGIYPAQKYNLSTENVITALAGRATAGPVAARNLYLQFLFAWLTGNGDLHAKNVSILQTSPGEWRVAPIYDIPCTAVYRDMTMALSVDGRVKNLRRRHWEALADAIGLRPRARDAAMQTALAAAARIDLRDLPFTGSLLHGAQRELGARRSALTR